MATAIPVNGIGWGVSWCCSSTSNSSRRGLSMLKPRTGRRNEWGQILPTGNVAAASRKQSWQILSTAKDDAKPQKEQQQSFEEFLPDFDELDKDELQSFLNLELQSGLDMDTYKHYEIMFIIHEKNADDVQTIIEKVTSFILENKGFIYRINDWGMRRLAYKIKKAEKGNYVLMNIEIDADVINNLNTMFEKDERVIRHMVMSQNEAVSDDFEPPEEWGPSSASAEGGETEEGDDEEYDEDEDEDEKEEQEEEGEEDPREGDLVLERHK